MNLNKTKVLTSNDSKRKQELKDLSKGCEMYAPCPINYRCMNRAAHLYVRCQNCEVKPSQHNHKARAWAIRRENFAVTLTKETQRKLAKWDEERKADE